MKIAIEVSTAGINEAIRTLNNVHPQKIRRGVALALNEYARKSATIASRQIRAAYPELKLKLIYPDFNHTKKASTAFLEAVVTVQARPFNMKELPVRKRKETLAVSIKSRRATLTASRPTLSFKLAGQYHQIKGAFFIPAGWVMARGAYQGNSFQFRRKRVEKTGADLPIRGFQTLSTAGAMSTKKTHPLIMNTLERGFTTRALNIIQNQAKGRTR